MTAPYNHDCVIPFASVERSTIIMPMYQAFE